MRAPWIRAVPAVLLGALVAGCGIGEATGGEDPVPTLSVRPSPSSPTPSTESGFTLSAEPSASSTSPGADASESGQPSATTEPPAQPAEVDLGTAPTSYDEAAAYVAKAGDQGGTQQHRIFRTPEDIYCVMSSDYLDPACELPQGTGVEDAQACRNAMGDRVGRVEVTDRRARPVCNTDTIRETVPQTVEPVAVVTDSRSGLACAVADIGVTCVQSQREIGFFLGLDSYATFG